MRQSAVANAWTIVALLGGTACSRAEPPTAPATVRAAAVLDAGPAAVLRAPAVRASALEPVFAIGDRRYFALGRWLVTPLPDELLAWTAGPTVEHELAKLRRTSNAPAAWRAAIGTKLTGYRADGGRCDGTIGEMFVIGYGSDSHEIAPDEAMLVSEVVSPGCVPVIVTNRTPVFYAPITTTAAQREALTRAFNVRSKIRGELQIDAFRAPHRTTVAIVAVEREIASNCGVKYSAVRVVFELPASGAPVFRGQSDAAFGSAPMLAVFDSDGDGGIEAVFGSVRFDYGMTARFEFASYFGFGAEAESVAFSYRLGCD